MSNIKEGMLCLTINCQVLKNNGHTVTAVSKRGIINWILPDGSILKEASWNIDLMLIAYDGKPLCHVGESQLLPLAPPNTDEFVLNEVVKELCHD